MATRRSLRAADGSSPRGSIRGRHKSADSDVLVVLAVAWLVSALDVTGTLLSGRPFGVEATLALLALCAIPVIAWPRRGPAGRPAA